MDAPDPPDPRVTAEAQKELNRETAITQYQLGATDIDSPVGSLEYELIGYTDEGNPRYRQNIKLNEAEQRLLDLQRAGLTEMGEAGVAQAGRVRDVLGTPFDINAARGSEIADIQKTFLDPEWDRKAESLEASLLNKGIRPGSEAYARAHEEFENDRSRAYDQMFLDAYEKGNLSALTERRLPLEELNALLRGPTAGAPSSAAPQPGVAPVDYTGLVSEQFKAQQSGYNAMMGAIGSALGTAGGWAATKWSDRRLKRNVELVGFDPRGWGVYLFHYLGEHMLGARHLGYMADEVAMVRPDAVHNVGGMLAVDYGALIDGR